MIKNLFGLVPIWVKISVIVALLGAIGIYVDNLCNSEKRSLKSEVVDFKKEIKRKNDTILKIQGEAAKKKQDKKNETFNLKMECKKLQREEYEDPYIDAAGNLYF